MYCFETIWEKRLSFKSLQLIIINHHFIKKFIKSIKMLYHFIYYTSHNFFNILRYLQLKSCLIHTIQFTIRFKFIPLLDTSIKILRPYDISKRKTY